MLPSRKLFGTGVFALESFHQHTFGHPTTSRAVKTRTGLIRYTNGVETRIFLWVSGWQPRQMGKYISPIRPQTPNGLYSGRSRFICLQIFTFGTPVYFAIRTKLAFSDCEVLIEEETYTGQSLISSDGFRPVLVQHGLLPPPVPSFRFHLSRGLRSMTIMRCMQDQLSWFSTQSFRWSASFSASIQSSFVVYAFPSVKARTPEAAIGSMHPHRHVCTMTNIHFSPSLVAASTHSPCTSYIGSYCPIGAYPSPLSPENRASEALLSIVPGPPLDILTGRHDGSQSEAFCTLQPWYNSVFLPVPLCRM